MCVCVCGAEEETVVHLVAECPRYRAPRHAIFGCVTIPNEKLPNLDLSLLAYFLKKGIWNKVSLIWVLVFISSSDAPKISLSQPTEVGF